MDKKEALKIVQEFGPKLEELPDHFKKDKEIVLAAVKSWVHSLQFADKSLKKDKGFVLDIVKQSGTALEFLDDTLKKDKEFVLQAVKQYGGALQYADDSLKKDKKIVLEAVKQDGNNIQYAHESFRKDKEIVLEAVKKSGDALEFVDDSFKKDKEIVKLAIIENERALLHVDKELQNDSEFIKKMIMANGFIIDSLAELKNNLAEDKEIILQAYKTKKYGYSFVGVGHTWWQGRSIEWIQKNQDFVSMVVKDQLSNFLCEKPDLELKKFTKDNYVYQSAVLICKILDVFCIKSLDPKKIVKVFENNKKENDEVMTINDTIFTSGLTISELSLQHNTLQKSVVKSFGSQFGTIAVFGEDDKNHFLNHYNPDFKMAVEFAEEVMNDPDSPYHKQDI